MKKTYVIQCHQCGYDNPPQNELCAQCEVSLITATTSELSTSTTPESSISNPYLKTMSPPETTWAKWELITYIIIILFTIGLRMWDLGAQALHHDESLHTTYSWYLYSGQGYQHNPMMHGPFQFMATASMFYVLWDSESIARLLPAIFGTVLVAIPILLRNHLGRNGALITSIIILFSPTMSYFSRFARNDIYMAVWTLLLVGFMWSYLHTSKRRYLWLTSAVLALAFATKESTYILVALLGSYLLIRSIPDFTDWIRGRRRLRNFSPAGQMLILMATLTLPLGAAGIALFQDAIRITLANDNWLSGPIGMPSGTGIYIAMVAFVMLLSVSIVVGLFWRTRIWLACFTTFSAIWILFYTTAFTNFWGGMVSGLWQSLGYWIVQQGVGRGDQPWYYYLLLGLNYEYLPIIIGILAIIYYARRGNQFSRFLVYWAITNAIFYSFASEKMPWLLVGISLPFIVLTGKFIGETLDQLLKQTETIGEELTNMPLPWHQRNKWSALLFMIMLGILAGITGRWLFISLAAEPNLSAELIWLLVFIVPAQLGACIYLLKNVDRARRIPLVCVSLAMLLLILTIPTTFRLVYENPDVPVEMLVYTQTAPDIPQIMNQIKRLGEETGKGNNLKITVDSTDGFSWPWAWYLRDYESVNFTCLSDDTGCDNLKESPGSDVVLLAARNRSLAGQHLRTYGSPILYTHRWWFPESYKRIGRPENYPYKWWLLEHGSSIGIHEITNAMLTKDSWCRVADYFTSRKFKQKIGSVGGYAYFPEDFVTDDVGVKLTHEDTIC